MEEKSENTEVTAKKVQVGVPFKKGDDPRRNLDGRPVGSLDFKTKFEIFLNKLAKQNDMSPQEIDEQLFAVAYKKAKEGDYQFWRDVHDRVYGKPLQKNETDITSQGERLVVIPQVVTERFNLNGTDEETDTVSSE